VLLIQWLNIAYSYRVCLCSFYSSLSHLYQLGFRSEVGNGLVLRSDRFRYLYDFLTIYFIYHKLITTYQWKLDVPFRLCTLLLVIETLCKVFFSPCAYCTFSEANSNKHLTIFIRVLNWLVMMNKAFSIVMSIDSSGLAGLMDLLKWEKTVSTFKGT